MPIIDVSQKSYRALVIAAHKRGMSIDRYIQRTLKVLPEPPDGSQAPEASANTEASGTRSPHPVADFTPAPANIASDVPTPRPRRAVSPKQPTNEPSSSFDALWGRIEESAGQAISTKRGQDFTYEVDARYLTVIESGARIPRSQFKKALGQWPQKGPSNIRGIYAASTVWAVLADERILDSAA